MHQQKHIVNSKGSSLIELLVSMTLGIVLLGGLMSMYFGSREGDKIRDELNGMDLNASVALRSIRETIEHAGYASVSVSSKVKPFFKSDDVMDNPLCRDGKKLIVSGSPDEGGNSGLLNPPDELLGYTTHSDAGDAFTVVYRPDSPYTGYLFYDCATRIGDPSQYPENADNVANYPDNYPYGTDSSTKPEDNARLEACSTDTTVATSNGMQETAKAKIYSGLYLTQQSNGPKQLVCYGSRSSNAEPHVIADYIDNMQIRYGVKSGDKTSFKNASNMSEDEWNSITSVQVALLIVSEDNVVVNPSNRKFHLLDITITKPASDRKMYKVYSTTIFLANQGI